MAESVRPSTETLTERKLPWSQEAELGVIGSCLYDPNCIPEVLEILKPEHFFQEHNRAIFTAIQTMFTYARPIDAVTLPDELKQQGVYWEGAVKYLTEALQMTPTSANVRRYANIVRDQALLRSIIETCDECREDAFTGSDAEEVLELAERKIYALRQGRTMGGLLPVSQVVQTVYADLQDRAQSGKPVPGITTGFRDVDTNIMGLNNSDLVLIAARPGMGKTSLALNMAVAAARDSRKTVAIFSLEMSREQLVTRLLSFEGLIPMEHLLSGQLNLEEWRGAARAAQSLSELDIRVNDNPSLTVAEMSAQCRRLNNLGLVIIDYLQLMQSAGSGNKWSNESRVQVVSDISRMMKIMAKELNVPVICLSQLSRANEQRSDKRPMLSDLRESGSIEQDADIVMGIYREGYYKQDMENPNLTECIVLKNRHGKTGTINLTWVGEYTVFRDCDTRHVEP